MSDEWKWVLRTSSAMRPVLRLLPVAIDARRSGSIIGRILGYAGMLKVSPAMAGSR
jgi:hypothetical protein